MQNPIGEADLEWILHRNCEGTEQLLIVQLCHSYSSKAYEKGDK